jgi:hypothetical protein
MAIIPESMKKEIPKEFRIAIRIVQRMLATKELSKNENHTL